MQRFFSFNSVRLIQSLVAVLLMMAVSRTAAAQQTTPPEKVLGRNACKQCHVSELNAWEKSVHGSQAFKLLDHPKAAEFAKALGVDDIKGASLCTQCHGTQQKPQGKLIIAKGNSCESCHGGAGGEDGWLAIHYDFGQGRTVGADTKMSELLADRSKETKDHRAARDATCLKAGLNRSANAFEIAKNCLQCHLVPQEKLIKAGHPFSSKFEFVEWSQGEVRHNFLLDGSVNAEIPTNWSDPLRNGPGRSTLGRKRLMFVVGQLADLEVSLRIRGKVTSTKRKTLGDEANDRILDIQEELEDLKIAELDPVLAAIEDVDKKSLRKITSGDAKIYNAMADNVAVAARSFAAVHASGDTLPDDIKIPTKTKGDVYKP